MPSAPKRPVATIEDALARPESEHVELIRGTLTPKAIRSNEHSAAQTNIVTTLHPRFSRRPGGHVPGGWWIRMEVDVQLGDELFRPDVAGWRRERCPVWPPGRPMKLRPDWICEVLSPSNEDTDRVDKLQSYFQAGVPHYWLANPVKRVLEVYRRTDVGYALVLSAKSGQLVRAEPFDAVELRVDDLFEEPEDG